MDYNVSSPLFDTMTISDGTNTIAVDGGTFLSSSYIQTDSYSNIDY
jgi:hypothetical protein